MIAGLAEAVGRFGMLVRGGFHIAPAAAVADGIPGSTRTILIIGNAGPDMGRIFKAQKPDGPHPLDRWTKAALMPLADANGATALFPSDGPPYYPFLRWAQQAEPVTSSPLGMLIHPDYGLWHAYRAVFLFDALLDLPAPDTRPSPCEGCPDRPCLTTCPVDAFQPQGYQVVACRAHIVTEAGADCLDEGCRARRACPVGREFYWGAEMAGFHMQAFKR